ncbi:hypothetical protein [Myxococcus phage Mx1]|nr:hypothetical protein [Myxococcus phage Mx1]
MLRWLILVVGVFVLNAVDAVSTYLLVAAYGLAIEANPLMAALLAWNPLAFLAYKAIVGGLFLFLGREKVLASPLAKPVIVFVFCLYLFLMVLHGIAWLG